MAAVTIVSVPYRHSPSWGTVSPASTGRIWTVATRSEATGWAVNASTTSRPTSCRPLTESVTSTASVYFPGARTKSSISTDEARSRLLIDRGRLVQLSSLSTMPPLSLTDALILSASRPSPPGENPRNGMSTKALILVFCMSAW